jgi:predicted acylesterase/phospholipase RssA
MEGALALAVMLFIAGCAVGAVVAVLWLVGHEIDEAEAFCDRVQRGEEGPWQH